MFLRLKKKARLKVNTNRKEEDIEQNEKQKDEGDVGTGNKEIDEEEAYENPFVIGRR